MQWNCLQFYLSRGFKERLLTELYRKFFGAKGSKPEPQQSKLSFATKAAPKKEIKKEVKEEDDADKDTVKTRASPSSMLSFHTVDVSCFN